MNNSYSSPFFKALRVRSFLALAFLPVTTAVVFYDTVAFAADAKSHVEALGKEAHDMFSSGGSESSFESLLNSYFNVDRIAQNALPQLWAKASDAQRSEYKELFRKDIVRTYYNLLKSKYANQTLRVNAVTNQGSTTCVDSDVISSSGRATAHVRWMVEGGLIVDVEVENASTLNAKIEEYRGLTRDGGGTMDGFLSKLAAKLGVTHTPQK